MDSLIAAAARARCVVAEAEVALAMRDLGGSLRWHASMRVACREGHEIRGDARAKQRLGSGDVLRGPLCVTTHDERAARFGMTSSRSGSPQRRSGSVANTPDREPEDDRQFADRRGR